jgi:hypothetical protein
MHRLLFLAAAATLLAETPRQIFFDDLSKLVETDAKNFAKSCALDKFRAATFSDSLSYNQNAEFRKENEKPEALAAVLRGALQELSQSCAKDAAFQKALSKKTIAVTTIAFSYRAPVDDAAANSVRAGFNGNELQVKLSHGKPMAELLPAGRLTELVKARLR